MNCFSESDSFDMVDIVTMESRLDFFDAGKGSEVSQASEERTRWEDVK